MKKSLVVLLFTILFSLPAASQIKFGIKAGAAAVLTPVFDITFGAVGIEPNHTWGYGIYAGVFSGIYVDEFYIQPEMSFESDIFEYIVIDTYDTRITRQTINRLRIPLLLGVQFDMIRIYLGPAAAIKIGSAKYLTNDVSFDRLYKKISFDYEVGIGIDLHKNIDLEVRYRGYLGKNYEGMEKIGYQTFTLNKSNSALLLGVAYKF